MPPAAVAGLKARPGAGRPLFTTRTALSLVDSKAWPTGTITARYAAGV